MIIDYNKSMGGVDKLDQFRSYYDVGLVQNSGDIFFILILILLLLIILFISKNQNNSRTLFFTIL